ncbi:NAD(P)-dependent oxidoreductase [Streptomyces sp. HUAS TT3]|uniref:NAD(P)-dependent oxidoreductase n=1 Tax=Streptomyces sp. HUAS TT3 TaxID=3447510 RepID=UPI003F65DA5E
MHSASTNTNTGTGRPSVTVIGLGPMGQAMAAAFLDRGYEVTLWNRTAARADALVARGARLAPDVAQALAASGVAVVSLTDYAAMYEVLGPAAAALAGRVLVNLSSDTPEQARAAARWAAERGAVQLTGGVTVPPSGIGRAASLTFYSGPREVFDAVRPLLEVVTGRTDHRGEDPGAAALFYQLGMTVFWTAMLGYWQALALARANGLTAADVLEHATGTANSLPDFFGFYADRIDAGRHDGDVDRLAMALASVEHVRHTHAAAGVDTTLPAAVAALVRRGMDAGHAADSFSALVALMGTPAGA